MIRFLSFKDIDDILYKKKKRFCDFILNQIYKKESKFNNKPRITIFQSKLERDILRNKIYYKNNCFFGIINKQSLKQIIKIGGVYNKTYNGYYLPSYKIPDKLLKIIKQANDNYKSFEDFTDKQIKKNIYNISTNKIVSFVLEDYTAIFDKLKTTAGEENLNKSELKQEIINRANKSVEPLKKDIKDYIDRILQENKRRKVNFMSYKDKINDGICFRCGTLIDYVYRDVLISYQKSVCKLNNIDGFYWLDINYLKGNKNYRHTHGEFTERSIKGKVFDMNNPPIDKQTGHSVLPGEEPNCSCIPFVDRQQFLKAVSRYKK